MTHSALPSLEVTGYRGLHELRVDRLGQVNLVVGRNNAGKSTFLEAIRLYASRASIEVVRDVLVSRDEVVGNPELNTTIDIPSPLTFESLFSRDLSEGLAQNAIRIGPIGLTDNVLSISMTLVSESPPAAQLPLDADEIAPPPSRNVRRPALLVQFDQQAAELIALDEEIWYSARGLSRSRGTSLRDTSAVFVPASGLTNALTVRLYDSAMLNGLEDDVIASLRIIDPTVRRLFFIDRQEPEPEVAYRRGPALGPRRIPMVQDSARPRPVPLRSKGDGMNRMFGIILALVNASRGVLLIDEIENGIHYSVQEEMWALLMDVARRLDAQVFATSHSWDCITAFQRAASRDTAVDGCLIRLQRSAGRVEAVPFDEAELEVATEENIEVR